MRGLSGRVAFVTGAAGGIGSAIVERLVEEGARVAVADLDRAAAEALAGRFGASALALGLDVTDGAGIAAAVAACVAGLGPIDILVNNAGWDSVGPFVDTDEATWDRVLAINLRGPIACTRAVLDGMLARGSGAIVNIGSDAARVGSSGEAVYSAAKAGVLGFTKTMARELARQGIRVNAVCPGPTDTPLLQGIAAANPKLVAALERAIPLGRVARPAEIAAAVAFLASDDAGFITGQTLSVSGGLTMA